MAAKSPKTRRSQATGLRVVSPPTNGGKPGPRDPVPISSARRAKRSSRNERLGLFAYATVAGVVLALLMIGLNLASVTASTQAAVANRADPTQDGRRSLGSPDAPVVIEEYVDFQCPACRAYVVDREPQIQKDYVDTGKVRLVVHNFPFLGPESFLAAEAAEAAADQGHYWAYRQLLFQRQGPENSGTFTADKLKAFASELGLDRTKFDAALDGRTYKAQVEAEAKDAEARGVKVTPTLFVDGQKFEGVPPANQLNSIIDQELAKKK